MNPVATDSTATPAASPRPTPTRPVLRAVRNIERARMAPSAGPVPAAETWTSRPRGRARPAESAGVDIPSLQAVTHRLSAGGGDAGQPTDLRRPAGGASESGRRGCSRHRRRACHRCSGRQRASSCRWMRPTVRPRARGAVRGRAARTRPSVLVLTDGSGAGGQSRLPSTSRLLAAAGATPGAVFGRLTDRALYAAILARDAGLALGLVDELTTMIVRNGIDYVVADALEGYNPAHDLCHVLVSAAVELAARAGRRVVHLDFPLVGRPDAR